MAQKQRRRGVGIASNETAAAANSRSAAALHRGSASLAWRQRRGIAAIVARVNKKSLA
jgi:hypothetical protein